MRRSTYEPQVVAIKDKILLDKTLLKVDKLQRLVRDLHIFGVGKISAEQIELLNETLSNNTSRKENSVEWHE